MFLDTNVLYNIYCIYIYQKCSNEYYVINIYLLKFKDNITYSERNRNPQTNKTYCLMRKNVFANNNIYLILGYNVLNCKLKTDIRFNKKRKGVENFFESKL